MKYKPIRSVQHAQSQPPTSAQVQVKTEAAPPLQIIPQPQQVAPSLLGSYISGMQTASRFRG